MLLTFDSRFISIKDFQSIKLNNFTVLTGKNGGGKTHLLTAILKGYSTLEGYQGRDCRYFDYKNFAMPQELIQTGDLLVKERENAWKLANHILTDINFNLEKISKKILESNSYKAIQSITKGRSFLALEKTNFGKENQDLFLLVSEYQDLLKKELDNALVYYSNYPALNIQEFYTILENWPALISTFKENDFMAHYQPIKRVDNFLPAKQLSKIFLNYWERYNIFLYKQWSDNRKRDDKKFFKEFTKENGPKPWELLNDLLKNFSSFSYKVNDPEELIYDHYVPNRFQFRLIHKNNGAKINVESLSSGEKIIFMLVMTIYTATKDNVYPSVLLLDEIDAFLHPSQIHKLIDTIQEVFIKELKMKVILATHSPTTVALAPESSIHIVHQEGFERIEKVSKDKVLKILTEGVPSFSINYENRRQVFVESPNDVSFYERLYNKLSKHLNPEISLSFISSGDSRTDKNGIPVSNCAQVVKITGTLRDAGNKFIYGIVDWDLKDTNAEGVQILGHKQRYSIENYILDPILVSVLLFQERIISRSDLGLEEEDSSSDIKRFNASQLQFIIDFFISQLLAKAKEIISNIKRPTPEEQHVLELLKNNNAKSKVVLVNNLELEIPTWYLQYQGHSLEDLILKIFPKLNKIKAKKEDALKLAILDRVVDDMPGLVSMDFVELFCNIQKA